MASGGGQVKSMMAEGCVKSEGFMPRTVEITSRDLGPQTSPLEKHAC